MRKIHPYLFRLLICTSVVGLSPHVSSAATCKDSIAKAVSVQGTVVVQRTGESQWQPVKLNDTFCPGDTIQVKRRSRAEIAQAKSTLRLNANTTITLKGIKKKETSLLDLTEGAAYFFSHAPRSLEVVTPSANAAVRGTEFFVSVEEGKTSLTIFEGEVLVSNPAGTLTLARGQSAVAEAGQAPFVRVVVRPRDAVQWTLYYPPVLDVRAGDFPGADAFRKGDLQQAFDSLEGAAGNDPRLLTYLASLELSVGNVDAARTDIDQALGINSKFSDAFALKAIIAVAQNDKDGAFSNAQKAVQADPKSADAQIALSYAQQAKFDLDGALTSLQIAVQLDPKNALAWARLAELWSSHGNRDDALEAAQKAVSLNPNLSRTQTVLGFAHLVREDTDEARAAFQKAIEVDQADPLPKLGMGLAKIRDDELEAGRGDLEAAVGLDPENSLMRSYLGKAYYEEKRSDKASAQFAIAKKKDPKDPTPYLYDAIEKQTTNRPVEALHDLQTAIELNDNRAPFRSKLLLDSDLASRSAALGRIYTDLGFQNRALLEGWLSVNTDPSNFSAHRFLADSYSSLQRHEIARVSELLQSQLLQPINMTPIQPRLGESNLFLISAQGPGSLSFNEFNPLFNRDGITLQGNGIVGENDTYSGEGIISGIFDRASFSIGYSKFDTNGWRANANQEDDLANAFVQYQLTPQTSIQAEYRYRKAKTGDVSLRFLKDDFFTGRTIDTETQLARFGFHHAFAPGSDLIGNVSYQDSKPGDNLKIDTGPQANPFFPFNPNPTFPGPILELDFQTPVKAFSGELQYLHRTKHINVVSGAGIFEITSQQTFINAVGAFTIPSNPPLPFDTFTPGTSTTTETDKDRNHINVYSYIYIKPWENLTLTVGASGDFLNTEDINTKESNQFNQKYGFMWEPFQGTVLRAAAFRVLKRTLITNQTLEPTQVAGFNQFFDDVDATDAWRYGGGIDQKFSKNLYGGGEFTYRDLDVPFTAGGTLNSTDWEEKISRGYLFWTPHNWLALTAEYRYEQFERSTDIALGAKKVDTHWLPLGLNFFHPCGLSVSLKGTWVDQQGSFDRQAGVGTFEDGKDEFWLADAAIQYRFPKRYGFLTLGGTNLFEEDFQHFDTNFGNPRIQPDRQLFVSVTLNLR